MKVLIVDDDDMVRFTVKRQLTVLGCETVEASDGIQALELLTASPVNLVILDVRLPKLSGLEVLQTLRSSQEFSDLPVVMVSGYGDSTTMSEALRLGISDFLVKPLRLEAFKARLKQLLASIREGRPRQAAIVSARGGQWSQTLLLVDPGDDFHHLVSNVLSRRYRIVQCESGLEAIELSARERPAVLLIGEDIGLFGPKLLARKVRTYDLPNLRVLLVTGPSAQPEWIEPGTFDGVLTRTFVPDEFARQFEQAAGRAAYFTEGGPFAAVRRAAESGAQQALGMMAQMEVNLVTALEPVGVGTSARLIIKIPDETAGVRLELWCPLATARTIASRMLQVGDDDVTDEDGSSAIGELLNLIAGRVQRAIRTTTESPKFSLPSMSMIEGVASRDALDIAVRFASAHQEVFFRLGLIAITGEAARLDQQLTELAS